MQKALKKSETVSIISCAFTRMFVSPLWRSSNKELRNLGWNTRFVNRGTCSWVRCSCSDSEKYCRRSMKLSCWSVRSGKGTGQRTGELQIDSGVSLFANRPTSQNTSKNEFRSRMEASSSVSPLLLLFWRVAPLNA